MPSGRTNVSWCHPSRCAPAPSPHLCSGDGVGTLGVEGSGVGVVQVVGLEDPAHTEWRGGGESGQANQTKKNPARTILN
jgi:hypothetical protein